MEAMCRLDLLRYYGISSQSYTPELPTWVPRWDHLDALPTPLSAASADGNMWAQFQREPQQDVNILSCKGLDVGLVQRTSAFRHTKGDIIKFALEIYRVLYLVEDDLGHDLLSSKHFRTLLCRSLLGGGLCENLDPPGLGKSTEQAGSAVIDMILDGQLPDFHLEYFDPIQRDFLIAASYMCESRALAIADGGQVVIGPRSLTKKDQLYILLGCSSPLALRSIQDSNSATYQVAGQCYMNSLMAGEAILGPLPGGWRRVSKATGYIGHQSAFRETATSATQWEDPRLRLVFGDDYEERFQRWNIQTMWDESRMLDEVTKRRGLEWKTFNLV